MSAHKPDRAGGSKGQPAAGGARPAATRGRQREARTAATRSAIVSAALDEFAANGFAGARLDDVARRAGVAKGTIYVHFRDKETLFEELVRTYLGPIVTTAESQPVADMTLRAFADRLIGLFVQEVYGTRRKDVLRLIMTEGHRFPQLAQIYYREVVQKAIRVLRAAVRRAIERGEIRSDALERFPQLLVAPLLTAVMWDALFARFEPLDVKAMMQAHLDILFAALTEKEK